MELIKINIPGIDDIYMLSTVEKEFRKAVNETWRLNPPWKRYQRKLIEDLAVLCDQKEKAIDLPQFEKLKGEDNLYSIRHPETPKNVRILYTLLKDEGKTIIVVLTAFLEKNSQDYSKAIRKANERIRWLLEE